MKGNIQAKHKTHFKYDTIDIFYHCHLPPEQNECSSFLSTICMPLFSRLKRD